MSAALSLHLAFHLVPYLDPTDIVCARRVCKTWCSIFSSNALSQVALRVHFPLCREVQSPSRPVDYSIFNRISKRYTALKSGIPRQELRVPITASHRNTYIWTFSENLLVLQSSHYPRAVLTLIYLDARTEPRRIVNGELVLGASGGAVTRVKVCRNMLVVERTDGAVYSLVRLCSVDCFRVSLSPGDSRVIATKVSSFDTFEFGSADYSHETISDHSGKYYAVYSKAKGDLRIWNLETGEMARRIPDAEFSKITNVMNVLVIAKQGLGGPQQVVVAGNDGIKNSSPHAWRLWSNAADFKVFPIEAGSSEWTGRTAVPEEQQGRFLPSTCDAPFLVSSFKVPRRPAGITSLDTPDAPGYLSEEIGLTFWYWDSDAGSADYFYHNITPGHPPMSAPDVPLVVERRFRMAFKGCPYFSPFNVGPGSGLSLAINTTNRNGFIGPRLELHRLCARSFYPSTTPGIMELEWEASLKSSTDKEKDREIFFGVADVLYFSTYPLVLVDENEFATAFLEVVKGGMDLVLVLWDEGFHGELPLGGKVLN